MQCCSRGVVQIVDGKSFHFEDDIQFQSRSWTHNRLGRLSHKPLRRLKSSWNCRELRKTVKAVGRGRNRLGRLRTGRNARGGYGIDGWGGNHPKHSFYGDFRGSRTVTLFSTRVLDREERKHRKRPSEINPDGKVGESWPEGRSESQLETAGILGHTTVQASMVDAGPPCSAATGSDPYTNGSRLGCREMASVLMMRIRGQELSEAVNGCIVLERDTGDLYWMMAVESTDWIEGWRAEYVLTDPGVISDWFWGAKHC
ncbi:hypothetical protein YC2023_045530 [Brassica napus]